MTSWAHIFAVQIETHFGRFPRKKYILLLSQDSWTHEVNHHSWSICNLITDYNEKSSPEIKKPMNPTTYLIHKHFIQEMNNRKLTYISINFKAWCNISWIWYSCNYTYIFICHNIALTSLSYKMWFLNMIYAIRNQYNFFIRNNKTDFK